MSDGPWLTIIGLGEDGHAGLSDASRDALGAAEIVFGSARHLDLLPDLAAETETWPVPFADGIERLLAVRGRRTVMLVSGDPFWFGAGTTLARHLARDEWVAHPGRATYSLIAARMGWPLEATECFGLHAAPMSRLRPALAPGVRLAVLLRDGEAVGRLASYLCDLGFGASSLTVHEALGGPRERVTEGTARDLPQVGFAHPVAIAIEVVGTGRVLSHASGRADGWFDNDGQITKRPVRALTLSALAPVPFEHLWDIGGGSGSIAIEWLLSHPTLTATTIEMDETRAARITGNAAELGVDRLVVVRGKAPEALSELDPADAVFVGGGLNSEMLDWLCGRLAPGTRIVANAVTLETETLLLEAHARLGGTLHRFEIAQADAIGSKRGWKAAYPIVQWSHVL